MCSTFVVLDRLPRRHHALGMYVGRNQRDANDYFVADRAIPWWAVMFSIVASETSALTFISIPGLAYIGNLGFLADRGRLSRSDASSSRTRCCRATYEGNLVTAYALLETAIRPRHATLHVDRVHGHARHGRLGARVRDRHADRADHRPAASRASAVMPVAFLVLGTLTMIYTYPRRHARRRVDGDRSGDQSTSSAASRRWCSSDSLVPGGWGAISRHGGGGGKAARSIDWYTGFDRAAHDVRRAHWRRVPRPWRRTAPISSSCSACCRRARSSRRRRRSSAAASRSFAQFTLFLMLGVGLWAFYEGRPSRRPTQIFPTFIIDQHAARAHRPARSPPFSPRR